VLISVESRDKFWWFGHSYSHTKAHQFPTLSAIVDDMLHNQAFAQVPFHSHSSFWLTLLSGRRCW